MSQPTARFNVSAARRYTLKSGEEKTHWISLGRATQWDDGGISIELHAVPVGNWFDGKISLFPEDKKEDQGQQRQRPSRQQPQQSNDDFDSDVPF